MPPILHRLNRPLYAVVAVAAIAGAVRFARLSSPDTRVFDEFYYSKAGCVLVGGTNKQCAVVSSDEHYWRKTKWDVGSWVHPPLGKWMIGLGEKVFGFDPFGWRFSAAAIGTLTAVLVALTAQLLWARPIWTFVAGMLLGTENLSVVLSRTGLLDVFLAFWVVAGFLCLALDKRWIERRTRAEPQPVGEEYQRPKRVPSPVWRPWRVAAGLAFGAAISTKWSGGMALVGAVILAYAWETSRRRRAGLSVGHAFGRAFAWESFGLFLSFVILPIAVYFAIYIPWFHHFGWSIRNWWSNQVAMFEYHKSLQGTALDPKTHAYTPTHPYFSRPWTWLLMARPVAFFAQQQPGGGQREILAIGNPAIFWASLATLPYLAFMWRRRHDWRAGFVLVAGLSQYLPWFLVSRPQFFFYAAPVAPFLVLADVSAVRDLADATIVQLDPVTGATIESSRHPYRPLAVLYVLASVALFAWFFPVLTGVPLSNFWWRARVWFTGWI